MTINTLTDGFDEHFELPSTLPEKLPTPFYQTKVFGHCLASISLVGMAGFSALAYQAVNRNWSYWALQVPIHLNIAAYFAILSYHLFTKSYYTDQNTRKAIQLEIKQNPGSIHDFIETHGWDNIRRYGLHIAPNLDPIVNKEQMREIALTILKDDPISFFNRIELNKTYIPITPGSFWEMIDHKLFTEEEIDGFAQKLAKNVAQISFVNLLENYPRIKEFKLDRYFDQKQVAFLDNQLNEFEKTKEAYAKEAQYWTDTYGKHRRLKNIGLILELADIHAVVFVIVAVLLVSYVFFRATNYVGQELAIKSITVIDPTFSLQPTNTHLDLVQNLSAKNKKAYHNVRKIVLASFENKWTSKQLEFNSL